MMTHCRSCNAEVQAPADWTGEALECQQCRERRSPAGDPSPVEKSPVPDADLRAYRLGMRVLGVVMLLLGVGLIAVQSSFFVRAWNGGFMGKVWAGSLALVTFGALYISLGVLAVRLYHWVSWAMAVVLGLATGYSVFSMITSPPPALLGTNIAVAVVVAALALMALLVALRGRRIRASGYTGNDGPRTLTRSGLIGAAIAMSLLAAGLVVGFVGAAGETREAQAGAARTAQWQRIAIGEGAFSAEMPGTPQPDDQVFDSPLGKISSRQRVVEAGAVEYRVVCVEYPEGFLDAVGGADKLLDSGRDTLVAQTNATVLREERGRLGLFPKRTLVIRFRLPDGPVDATMTQTMVLAEGRSYMCQSLALGKVDARTAQDEARFHGSFELSVK